MNLSQPDRTIPRHRRPASFRSVTREAGGTPVVVQQPADPATEAEAVPRLLESIGYLDDTDEDRDRDRPDPPDIGAGPRLEPARIRIPRSHAVLADDTEACPETILIHSGEVPPTVVVFDHGPPTAPGTP